MSAPTILSLLPSVDPNLVEQLDERIDIIKHKLKFLESKLTVACINGIEPLTIAGDKLPELIQIAGGIPILAGEQPLYLDWEDIHTANPDVLILMPTGFSMDETLKEVGTLLSQPFFSELKAVKNNRLYIANGSKYFNHHGPQIVDSLEILAEIINPKQFIFGYEGEGWMKFSL